jgi:hypothetical protein
MRNPELAGSLGRGLRLSRVLVVAQVHPEPQGARPLREQHPIAQAHQLTRQLARCQCEAQLRPDPRRLSTGERNTGNHRASL